MCVGLGCPTLVLWLVLGSLPGPAAAQPVLVLELVGPPETRPVAFQVVLSRVGRESGHLTITVPAGAAKSPRAALSAVDDGTEFEARAGGYWSAPERWDRSEGGEIRLRVFRTGIVSGAVTVATGASPPTSLWAEFEGTPDAPAPRIPRGRAECPVVESRWSCALPEGVLDLRLGHDGYVPAYYWGLELRRERQLSLGSLSLKRGSSLVGFLFEQDGVRPAAQCRVELATRHGAAVRR